MNISASFTLFERSFPARTFGDQVMDLVWRMGRTAMVNGARNNGVTIDIDITNRIAADLIARVADCLEQTIDQNYEPL